MNPNEEQEFRARLDAELAQQNADNVDPEFRERLAAEEAITREKMVNPVGSTLVGSAVGLAFGRAMNAWQQGQMGPLKDLANALNVPEEVKRKGENAIINYIKSQHIGDINYVGGESYKEAHALTEEAKEKARNAPPGFKYDPDSKQYIPENEYNLRQQARAKAEQERIEAERRKQPVEKRIAEKIPGSGKVMAGTAGLLKSSVPPFAGRTIAGGFAGHSGAEAYNRAIQGDVPGAAISGSGAVGGLLSLVPKTKARALGLLLGGGSLAADQLYTSPTIAAPDIVDVTGSVMRGIGTSSPAQQRAHGGLINKYAGGGVAKGGLSLAKKFGYDPAKVAKNYPEVLPGVPTLDPKTGKEFTKKVLSQEAEAVQKARKAAQAEIDKGQYTPFFDVTQRSYVNPADYPLVGRTLTDVLPKKAETIEKYRLLAESPEATERLKAAFAEGSKAPAAKDWYAMKQLEDAFVQELGPEAGKLAFRQRFAEPMAATTGGADPTSNLMMTAYTNFMREKGLPIPSAAHELPFPIGGRYVSGNMEQARRYHQQGSIPIDNPKRHNFASNFMGYRDRPTIDEQMMGLFAPGKGAPEPGTYGVYESALNKLAKEAGVEPVNFQDVAWAGAKKYQGKPMMQEINEMIYRTSRVTGETPEEVLKGYIRGNKPMYGLTGLGALAAQEDGGVNNPE